MIPKELMEVPEIAEAVSLFKETSYTQEELEQYDRYWDVLRTQNTLIHDAKEEGKALGRVELAKEMIIRGNEEGLSIEILSSISGLSKEEVLKIISEHTGK